MMPWSRIYVGTAFKPVRVPVFVGGPGARGLESPKFSVVFGYWDWHLKPSEKVWRVERTCQHTCQSSLIPSPYRKDASWTSLGQLWQDPFNQGVDSDRLMTLGGITLKYTVTIFCTVIFTRCPLKGTVPSPRQGGPHVATPADKWLGIQKNPAGWDFSHPGGQILISSRFSFEGLKGYDITQTVHRYLVSKS